MSEQLPGTIHEERITCGKPNCRCARGDLHTAHYRIWYEGGRRRKVYVRRADVERVRQACEAHRCDAAETRAFISGIGSRAMRQEIRAMLRRAGATRRQLRRFS